MSADARNTVNLIGGLVDNPEIMAGGKVLKARLAVDYAGNDSADKENRTGYFTLKVFGGDNPTPSAKFMFDQTTKGSLKKGSQIAIVGRLEHSRWTVDEGKRSEVQIIVESMTYLGGGAGADKPATAQATTATDNAPSW